jgi:hypothetical protein
MCVALGFRCLGFVAALCRVAGASGGKRFSVEAVEEV